MRWMLLVPGACGDRAGQRRSRERGPALSLRILRAGPLDGITDVAGVRVAHVTKIEGERHPHRRDRRSAQRRPVGSQGFGRFLCLQRQRRDDRNALDRGIRLSGRAGRPHRHARRRPRRRRRRQLGDRAPSGASAAATTCRLPVVAECDDGLLNDIQARAVTASDVVALLDSAAPGQFARGSVGAGTAMNAFGFRAGIGSASRVLPSDAGGYRVGVLVNDNTGSSRRQLTILGVPVGERLRNEYRPVFPKDVRSEGAARRAGASSSSIATDAPLDSRQLRALALRAAMGMARTGLTSSVGSGDLIVAFSTSRVFERVANFHRRRRRSSRSSRTRTRSTRSTRRRPRRRRPRSTTRSSKRRR